MSALSVERRAPRVLVSDAFRSLARHPQLAVGIGIIAVYILVFVLAGVLTRWDPLMQNMSERLRPPSGAHLFGTDQLGRDVFSRVLYGGRTSVPAALAVVLIGALVGTAIGSLAGYFGGLLDEVLMRTTDIVLAFPAIVLTLAVAAAFGPGIYHGILALSAVWWPQYVRVSRGLVLERSTMDYVLASRAAGQRPLTILVRVILPSAAPFIFVMGAIDVGRAILTFSILSFLGVGARPPTPEWGSMVSEGASVFDQWWVATFPALAILVVVFAFNLIGDALRDAMDPWSTGRT